MQRLLPLLATLVLLLAGCESQDIPPAHKGRMFDKTGALALWSGGKGFDGPILGPGTHYTGVYPEVRMIECAQKTVREAMDALTKDGVQFKLDLYASFGANCEKDESVIALLNKLTPEGKVGSEKDDKKEAPEKDEKKEEKPEPAADPALTVTGNQLYRILLRPALGEAVREAVSPHIANDINSKREEIFGQVKKLFEEYVEKQSPGLVRIYGLNLSNIDFPATMDEANEARAAQAIFMDKAVAERGRVEAEIKTMEMRRKLAESEASNEAAKIRILGQALRDYPEYNLNDTLSSLGAKGNLVVVPSGSPLALPTMKRLEIDRGRCRGGMSRPIEPTPPVEGDDADRLIHDLEHVPTASKEEMKRRYDEARAFLDRVNNGGVEITLKRRTKPPGTPTVAAERPDPLSICPLCIERRSKG
jgi:SPFH domain / Band 7 family